MQIVDNPYVKGLCLEMRVGDLFYRKSIYDRTDVESFDYAVESMLRTMLSTVVGKIVEDRNHIKETLCTS